jgi:hypothetical protein
MLLFAGMVLLPPWRVLQCCPAVAKKARFSFRRRPRQRRLQ